MINPLTSLGPPPGRGHGIAYAFDDRYLITVGGGRRPNDSPNKVSLTDLVLLL